MNETALIANPFAALSLIAAPAILTNAASVLAMSTSNRFLRAADRIHTLAARLGEASLTAETRARLGVQVNRAERQALMLLSGLRAAYIALAAFAAASLISIVGAALNAAGWHDLAYGAVLLALATGFAGTGGLMQSSVNLFRATRLSMLNISDEARLLRESVKSASPGPATSPLHDDFQP